MPETHKILRLSTAHQPCANADFGQFRCVAHADGTIVCVGCTVPTLNKQ